MRLALAVAAICAAATPAAAQLCHVGDVDDASEHASSLRGHHGHEPRVTTHVQATVTTEAATVEQGSYQGATVALSAHRDRFGLRLAVPYWRLDLLETPYSGIGDVIVQGHARLAGNARASLGAVVAVGLPTGKASYGLGMGHVMVMPAVWGAATRGKLRALALLGGGKSLGDGHEHAGFPNGPPVSPMAPFELDATVRLSYAAMPGLAVDVIGAVAVPLGDDRETRTATGLGTRYRKSHWQVGLTGLLGVTGDPFGVRGVLDVGYTL